MSLVVHRNFAQNQFIYFAYSKPVDATRTTVAVARARSGQFTAGREGHLSSATTCAAR
ncbi:MAG: hypothetical protein IPM70_09145 [Proteobacteria bacterium]|nr:hypothetical protein [Pseudomonadota bacterium]